MADPLAFKRDTLSLHAGQKPDPATGARAVPIYQTTSFVFDDTEQAASLFNLERAGHIYSRISNPTVAVLEERIAALEGGVGAVCTASGQAALHLAVATLMDAGGHIVSSASLYGGSHNMFTHTMPRFGIETSFVDPRDTEGFRRAMRPETRLLFGETLGNPGLEIMDLPAVAAVAHEAGVPLMIDNTFATPILCRPFELGCDIVMHSATKFLGGHGIAIGGVLVDAGTFDWEGSGRFPTLTEPYAGYHGIDFAEEFGPAAFIARARAEGLRDFGACMSPTNAFHILQGVESLPVRMARHVENARKVVAFLDSHDAVSWVSHPELSSHPDHARARVLLPDGAGAIFCFGVKGGRAAGRAFIEAVELLSHLANVGDAKSLVIHPASTTHQQMDAAALEAAGVGEDMVRLSIGLEDPDDLIADLERGPQGGRAGHGALSVELQVDGARAFAATGGRPFDPRLPVTVFVHGAAFDHTVWKFQARYFAWHGGSVLALDLPGHGRSQGPPRATIPAMADWLAALMDAAGVARGRSGWPQHGRAGRAGGRRPPRRAGAQAGAAGRRRRDPRQRPAARPRGRRRPPRAGAAHRLGLRPPRPLWRPSNAGDLDDRRRPAHPGAGAPRRAAHRSGGDEWL